MNTPNPIPSPRLLIGPREAAAVLGISERTLWDLSAREAVPSHRVGRLRRYSPQELDLWVQAGCPTDDGAAERVRGGARP